MVTAAMLITKVCTQNKFFTHKRCSSQIGSPWLQGQRQEGRCSPQVVSKRLPGQRWQLFPQPALLSLSTRQQKPMTDEPLTARLSMSCRAAASAAGLHSAWLLLASPLSFLQFGSFQLGLDSAGAGLSSSLSSTHIASYTTAAFHHHALELHLSRMGRGWAAMAEDRVCRADPGNIPAGEREAKQHFWGCTQFFFTLKPYPPVMMCTV